MNERKKKGIQQIAFGAILLAVAGGFYWFGNWAEKVNNFEECLKAGHPVMESYPRQCQTPEGKTFNEDIGNELEKDEMIRISEPRPNTFISSPLVVKGMARGNWFFEASFPVRLFDGNGEQLARGIAQAQGNPAGGGVNWMTNELVPFEATLSFETPTATTGTLLLDKDNPSGFPENRDALRVPVRFKQKTRPPP